MKRFVGAVILLSCAVPSLGQSSVERFSRQLEQIQRETTLLVDPTIPTDQRTLVDFGGYFTLNYLSVEDFNRETHVLREYDLVGYARVNIDGVHEFFARGLIAYQDFAPGDSFDGEGSGAHYRFDRAYYRFDLQRYEAAYNGRLVDYNLVFQGGRQLLLWGNGLTISQVLDAAVVDLKWGNVTVELAGGVTPVHDTVDFDSSRPHFDDHTFRGFYGAIASVQITPAHRPYAYVLFQQDYNHGTSLETGIFRTFFDYNSWYVGAGSSGSLTDRFLYGVEFVYEGGRGLSNSFAVQEGLVAPVDQAYSNIQAWAADIRLDYLLADPRRTRLSAEVILASGDDDRRHTSNTFGGNEQGSHDNAFNAFGLLNTGLAFAPNVSNLFVVRVGASTFPMRDVRFMDRLQIGGDFFVFNKMNRNGPIDEPTRDDRRFLGVEPDVFVNWQIASDVTLAARYGVFFPSSDTVISGEARQFIFVGLTFAF